MLLHVESRYIAPGKPMQNGLVESYIGRINPDRPLGGQLDRLDVDAAQSALEAKRASRLGLGVEEGAEAILNLANAKMPGAIRLVSIEKGHDPAKFAALPFGGGGALHTGALIKDVGLGSAIVPRLRRGGMRRIRPRCVWISLRQRSVNRYFAGFRGRGERGRGR